VSVSGGEPPQVGKPGPSSGEASSAETQAGGSRLPRPRRGSPGWLRAGPREGEDALRARYAVLVVFAGFTVTIGAFIGALIAFDGAQAVSTALAPITGLIGTIVGAYFGIQKGAEGKELVEEGRREAEQHAREAEERVRNVTAKLAGAVSDLRLVAWALDEQPPPTTPPQQGAAEPRRPTPAQ
jgi:phage tail tape-measure protein